MFDISNILEQQCFTDCRNLLLEPLVWKDFYWESGVSKVISFSTSQLKI